MCQSWQLLVQKADQSPSNYVDIVYSVSTLLAMWSFAIIFDLCKKPLSDVHITPKFFCLQLVLLIVGLQQSIISVFQMAGLIDCDPPLPAQTVAQRKCKRFVIKIIAPVVVRGVIFLFVNSMQPKHPKHGLRSLRIRPLALRVHRKCSAVPGQGRTFV